MSNMDVSSSPKGAAQTFVMNSVEYLASTCVGQFCIKKLDSMLWTLEMPAKYCVQGDSKGDKRKLPWIVFWVVLIYLQIFRVVGSKILVKFDKKPMEPKDIVRKLQTWRRTLRSIRFRGLRKIRERRFGNTTPTGKSVTDLSTRSSSPLNRSNKKRSYDDMLEHHYNALEDLMNRTFSDTDDTDSTFMINTSKIEESSSSSSSNEEDHSEHQQSSKSKNIVPPLHDTLPLESINENEHPQMNVSTKSTEYTFESTAADTDEFESTFMMSEDGSTSSQNDHSRTSNGKSSIGSKGASDHPNNSGEQIVDSTKTESGQTEKFPLGKESLNQPVDPADALMAQLVQKGGKPNYLMYGKHHQQNKKNSKVLIDGQLSGIAKRTNRNESKKATKSQEHLNTEKED